jgi:hypothetical protein
MLNRKFFLKLIIIIMLFSLNISQLYGADSSSPLSPKEGVTEGRRGSSGTEVGTGGSLNENPVEATQEAVAMALAGKKNKSPYFAMVFVTSGGKLDLVVPKLREILGPKTKIYGSTSDSRAVMTDKGFLNAAKKPYESPAATWKKGVAVMTVSSPDITFGIGSANLADFPSIQVAAKTAIMAAVKSAGKSPDAPPQIVLITPTKGIEEEVLEGVEEVIGKHTPILGGTAGGPQWGVTGEKQVYDQGVSLAVIYTDLPVGWIFEGGFDVRDPHTGVVTKVENQAIVEIDHRPALDVYDEWLGGKVKGMFAETGDFNTVRTFLNLHPIYRKYSVAGGQNYFLFSHPWPKDKTLNDKAIMTSTKIKAGERIYLSHGTWERLLNRIIELPKKAKINGGMRVDATPILGIGYLCAGVMGVIPENEREKMSKLINYANHDGPFIATFTWGEQGYFSGLGNKHVNLSTSFIVIGDK